jgi:hypothetical protein
MAKQVIYPVRFELRMTQDQAVELIEYAKNRGLTANQLIRNLIDKELKRTK